MCQDELVALASECTAEADHVVSKLGFLISTLVFVDLALEGSLYAHSAGLIDLNKIFPKGRFL